MVAWWLAFAGCGEEPSPDPGDPSPPTDTVTTSVTTTPTTTSSPVPELCPGDPPTVTSLFTAHRQGLVNTVDVFATLSHEAAAAVACTRRDDPAEVALYSADSAAEHAIALRGLAAGATYDCELVATCPASAAPRAFTVTTEALPPQIPDVEVSGTTTAPPFLLLGHDRHCAGDTARMLVFDEQGEVRWYYEGVPDIDVAYETQYFGGGVFAWGGGYYNGEPPEIIDVDHNVLYTAASPNAQSHVFHHDGKVVDSGEMMLMMIEGASSGNQYWDGFAIGLVDTTTNTDTYYFSSQTLVDQGDLPPGTGDPWHANWADYQHDAVNGDRLYLSLCNLGDVIAVDPATNEVLWHLGDTGDLEVLSKSGSPVPANKAYPQCQHGLEFVPFAGGGGGNLLVYDNGAHGRGQSRLVEYEIDEAAKTATLLWAWSEPVWMEPSWGDADYLPGGHVLGTMGHACWSPNGGDVSSVVELDTASLEVAWRLDFLDPVDAIYRSERVDACDVFPISTLCPGVQAGLDAIAPLLDPCGPGGEDVDQDGDGAFLCADSDCDDLDAASYPGAAELCDGADNDCDGARDDGFTVVDWYEDNDADGYGSSVVTTACAEPAGYAALTGDCDDNAPGAWPGNPEQCDGFDNDCDARTDELPTCWGCSGSAGTVLCTTGVAWPTAQQVCRDLGGDLVTIDNTAENTAVASLAGGEAWIGFNDRTVEGTYGWSDGGASTFTNWWIGEPNDSGGEDCAGTNFGSTGFWNDYNCDSAALPFVCEL